MTETRKRTDRLVWVLAAGMALCLIGCGGVSNDADTDAGAGADAAPMPDAPDSTTPPSDPASLSQTAGGGAASSASFRLDLRIGAPQPMGATSSAGYVMTTGPNAN